MLKMENKVLIGIGIVIILALGFYLFTGKSNSEIPSVSATGMSELKVVPDLASVSITIESKNVTSSDAQNGMNIIYNRVRNALISNGVLESEIQTVSFNVYPDYQWINGQSVSKGFVGRYELVVKTNNFNRVSGIADSAIDNGAYIAGINFELSQEKENEYKVQALEEAAKDAKTKAEATAKGLGKKLGKLLSVESQDFQYSPWVYYSNTRGYEASDMKVAASGVTPTENRVPARIQVRYQIK